MNSDSPLKEVSIRELYNGEEITYEIPIYQRNYSWGWVEISTLIQDVYGAFRESQNEPGKPYYIGTLVSFHKGGRVFEVIDGQQRLTTIYIVLRTLGVDVKKGRLTYRARSNATAAIEALALADPDSDVPDSGIANGREFARRAIDEIVPAEEKDKFEKFFQDKVHIIHYQVPRDIDLNHYFEVMNSRGEQLEKSEIVKALLMGRLDGDESRAKFAHIWECCRVMGQYVQQKYGPNSPDFKRLFGPDGSAFYLESFDQHPSATEGANKETILDLMGRDGGDVSDDPIEKANEFEEIIDFDNFLLIVLKLTRMQDEGFVPTSIPLDDRNLLAEFGRCEKSPEFTKKFGYNLLKAKYLLDNFVVHHLPGANDDAKWLLQRWAPNGPVNLTDKNETHSRLTHLLSMFEVSFPRRLGKNYLFYCLRYLFDCTDTEKYCAFLERLADKYFYDIYLKGERLTKNNSPMPGSFDDVLVKGNTIDVEVENREFQFESIYGTGGKASAGITLFVFNYLDYRIWDKYANEARSKGLKSNSLARQQFFKELGSSDFKLEEFDGFYFSKTRKSLEHYFPRALADGEDGRPDQNQINCLGNYAMIGSEMNSSGSNWTPETKNSHYKDESGKVKHVSVASLKFLIMMQQCEDAGKWTFEEIKAHQAKMLEILKQRRFDD